MSKEDTNDRYCTVEESLKQSLKEVKLIKEGKLTKENLNNMFKRIKEKELSELAQRANKRKNNPDLRHMPNKHDIEIANKNFEDLEQEIYSNIDGKD